jgi:hypothetical protein
MRWLQFVTTSFANSHFTLYLPPYLLHREAMGISPIFHGIFGGGLLVFCMWLIIMNMIFGGIVLECFLKKECVFVWCISVESRTFAISKPK